jgi:hypothetical protein
MRASLGSLALVSILGVAVNVSCSQGDAAPTSADGGAGDASDLATSDGGDDGGPSSPGDLELSVPQVDFSTVACGASASTSALTLHNGGTTPVAVSASITGDAFTVSPAVLTLHAGASVTLTLTTTVPTSATAGVPIVGALNLSTGVSGETSIPVPLSVTPSGASLAFAQGEPSTFAFPLTEVGYPASLALTLVNAGTASATFTVGDPSDPRFTFMGSDQITLAPGEPWSLSVDFDATDTTVARATAAVSATGTVCAGTLGAVTFSGRGTTGQSAGWPSFLDFGPADCGGSAPAERFFTVSNSSGIDAHLTSVAFTGAPGFTTNAQVGRAIFANGGSLDITVDAPAVPALSSVDPISATLTIQTDADPSPHGITLTIEPHGAILAFETSPSFGSFGAVPLLGSVAQAFAVINTGTAAASVSLITAASPPFTASNPTFAIDADGSQSEMATFAPRTGGSSSGSIEMAATGPLCAPLPAPIPLSGVSGPAPNVTPTSLSFAATCGGVAPAAQAFVVENGGNADMTWSLGSVTGVGAATYRLSASPAPGVLAPGASAIVTVTAAPVSSPAASTAPSAFAAQVVVTTDVPFDPPHAVTLGETPLGDQLSFSAPGPLRFGQVPIGTDLTQTISILNAANAGSAPAVLSFTLQGNGAVAYSAAAGSSPYSESITFDPTTSASYPATLVLATTDARCSPLPAPLALTGTGTAARAALSATTLAFGTDPADPNGFVACGSTGLSQTLTVSNVGNQSLHVTGLALGQGTSTFYVLSGAVLPALIPIAGSVTLLVTPKAIPPAVANPNDASPFADTLTVTTDAPFDAPHVVQLLMQARGAVVVDTPLATTWTFGAVSPGAIATLTSVLQNTGNAGVSVALQGLLQPSIFGLQNNPTTGGANGKASIVGQFAPPSASGSWSDEATLSVTALEGLCAPLPSQWSNPTIHLAGHSP